MRILMLTQFYPPIIGGEEQHVRNLSAMLVSRGHEVSVATLWHPGSAEFEIDQGVRIHRVRGTIQRGSFMFHDKGGRRHAPPLPDPEVTLALRRIVQQERPDIVHAHNWFVHSFVPLKAWSKAKLVMTLHDYGLVCAKQTLIHNGELCSGPALGKCIPCATAHYSPARGTPTVIANSVFSHPERAAVDMFLPVSRAVAEGTRLAASKVPYQVMTNFVPDNVGTLRDVSEDQLSVLPKEPYILFVGDLRHLKGVDVLVKAYAGLQDQKNLPPLVLIGRECPDTPKDLPPNTVVIKGLPHDAVMHAWNRSQIAVVPSVWADPCPTVVMEAMAMGKPVIGSRIGGMLDLINDGKTGLLVPPGDSDALREAMRRLLADPALCAAMGAEGRRVVSDLQASSVVPRIEQIYTTQLNGKKTHPIREAVQLDKPDLIPHR